MYKYNSIEHTNEKTEAFYYLKNNYDTEKTNFYNPSLSDRDNWNNLFHTVISKFKLTVTDVTDFYKKSPKVLNFRTLLHLAF